MLKGIKLFWNWRAWGTWGLMGINPFLPYEWRLFLGPLCVAKLTTNKPRRLSRQERRHLDRQLKKRAGQLARWSR